MKTSLFILLAACGIAFAAPAFAAADPTQATPQKTILKTSHSAMCGTPAGKLKKECARLSGTQPTHY